MLSTYDILETIRMIQDECLDIRTITMGISLLDCIDSDIDVDCEKVLLVHGDMAGKVSFAADLEEAISKNNKTSKVICVNKGYSLSI